MFKVIMQLYFLYTKKTHYAPLEDICNQLAYYQPGYHLHSNYKGLKKLIIIDRGINIFPFFLVVDLGPNN